jgi:hypothetical protein
MDSKVSMSNSASFDKHIVGITSLEILLHCLKMVREKETYWQWIYISLHSAVQAFMVLTLTGSNSLLTYRDADAELWLKNYHEGLKTPLLNLDSFMKLYEKTKSERIQFYVHSKKFVPSGTQDESIERLNNLRNDFIHYLSDFSSIWLESFGYPIVTDCLDYIDFLAFQSNNVIWDQEHYKTETERLLSECRAVINPSS